VVLCLDVADARDGRERADRHVADEPQLDLVVGEVAQRFDPIDLTRRPSRMIATRSQVFSTSLRMWLERKIVRPSDFASRMTP
jgi:hypothetical protein